MEDKLYTIPEVAKMLQIKESTVATWLRNGKLDGQKVGKSWRITKENLQEAFPEWAFSGFADVIEENRQENIAVKVTDNEDLYKELYPDAYERDQLNRQSQQRDPMSDYHEQCQEDLDRRFPYPYTAKDTLWNVDRTSWRSGDDPDAYWAFYGSKRKEEQIKLEKLLLTLKTKYGVPDEDLAEIKRTYENLQLLKIGELMWEI